MAYTLFSEDVENVSNLGDLPNADDGLTSAELKAVFDKAGKDIKNYLNGTLVPELDVGAAKAFTVTFPSGVTTYEFTSVSYGLNANSIVYCQPVRASQHLWNSCDVKCSAVTTNKLTFTAASAPSSAVTIQVLVIG